MSGNLISLETMHIIIHLLIHQILLGDYCVPGILLCVLTMNCKILFKCLKISLVIFICMLEQQLQLQTVPILFIF